MVDIQDGSNDFRSRCIEDFFRELGLYDDYACLVKHLSLIDGKVKKRRPIEVTVADISTLELCLIKMAEKIEQERIRAFLKTVYDIEMLILECQSAVSLFDNPHNSSRVSYLKSISVIRDCLGSVIDNLNYATDC